MSKGKVAFDNLARIHKRLMAEGRPECFVMVVRPNPDELGEAARSVGPRLKLESPRRLPGAFGRRLRPAFRPRQLVVS